MAGTFFGQLVIPHLEGLPAAGRPAPKSYASTKIFGIKSRLLLCPVKAVDSMDARGRPPCRQAPMDGFTACLDRTKLESADQADFRTTGLAVLRGSGDARKPDLPRGGHKHCQYSSDHTAIRSYFLSPRTISSSTFGKSTLIRPYSREITSSSRHLFNTLLTAWRVAPTMLARSC